MAGKLSNPKYERFCYEYVKEFNGTKAAIAAGYSKKTAAVRSSQLLTILNIQDRISELNAAKEQRSEKGADDVIAELVKIGFSNIQDFVNGGNSILELKHLDSKKVAAVSGVKTRVDAEGNTYTEIKLYDKVDALEKLGRHFGIFEKDNKQGKEITIKNIGFSGDEA